MVLQRGRSTALLSPRRLTQPFCHPDAGWPGKGQQPPGDGEATQILLEQGLARVGSGGRLPGLGWLRSISQVSWGTLAPGRATQAGLRVTAPCSDHLHQLGRDRSLRCKAASRLQGWMPKRGLCMGGGLHPPPPRLHLLGGGGEQGGTWGCHTERNKASTWVWCL